MEHIKLNESSSTLYEIDERLRLHDGKICTTRVRLDKKTCQPADYPEYIDVTEEVLNIICEGLTRRGF